MTSFLQGVLDSDNLKPFFQNLSTLGKDVSPPSPTRFLTPSSLKRKLAEAGHPEGPEPEKFRRVDPLSILIKDDKAEMNRKIETFINNKRAQIDASNQREFLQRENPEDANSSARTDAAQLNRTVQMKLDVVHNQSGPLERSTHRNHPVGGGTTESQSSVPLQGLKERIRNVQEHLNVTFLSSTPLDPFTRIKALEDKIIDLETNFPAWSAFHFNQPNSESKDDVLRNPPPETVITRTSAGALHTSVVPSFQTFTNDRTPAPSRPSNPVTFPGRTPVSISSAAAPVHSTVSSPGTVSRAESEGAQPTAQEKANLDSIAQRIEALKHSLLRQQQTGA
ncbi:uncharacterized protein EV422DRAFT_172464 [Fimicolochytrium jonesii]|uniref:uncharacterized protein n=1 Tax=Fimicolochytrium jonesii TaxID=1396493 RepID=UPI0022FDFA69|nr:uncharacterized protein EV422DRAFT_172464 [Fimicolochytrium jonesii]KAI8818572.1 hypothetical protein EV422DRAFT_172464 [Fimicolochytrium jonesii]